MKHKILLAIVMVIICSFASKPFAYMIGYCDEMGHFGKLDIKTALLSKAKGKTTSSTYTIDGIRADRRIKLTDVCFQVQPDETTGKLNPNLYVSLYKLSVDRKNRSFTVNNDGSNNPMMIPISIEAIDVYSYKVILGVALLQGEYAFIDKTTTTADGNVTVWTFGID